MTRRAKTSCSSIEDLEDAFRTSEGVVKAVDGVDLDDAARARRCACVGESGCGKSITARSILQIVGKPGRIVDGEIIFNDRDDGAPIDLAALDPTASADPRGSAARDIAMIFQEPMTSLSPVHTIGNQIIEAILLHSGRRKERRANAPWRSCAGSAFRTPGRSARRLSLPALGRHAPAGDDRDGAMLPTRRC